MDMDASLLLYIPTTTPPSQHSSNPVATVDLATVVDREQTLHWFQLVFAVVPLACIVGNTLVIAAVWTTKSLQTPTNYLLVSLACADLIVGSLVMPFSIYQAIHDLHWYLPVELCQLYCTLDVAASTASIINLVLISMDRLVAATKPAEYKTQKHKKRVYRAIAFTWIFSISLALPLVTGFNTKTRDFLLHEQHCGIYSPIYMLCSSIFAFYLPCLIMLITYGYIFYVLRRRLRAIQLQEMAGGQFLGFGADVGNIAASAIQSVAGVEPRMRGMITWEKPLLKKIEETAAEHASSLNESERERLRTILECAHLRSSCGFSQEDVASQCPDCCPHSPNSPGPIAHQGPGDSNENIGDHGGLLGVNTIEMEPAMSVVLEAVTLKPPIFPHGIVQHRDTAHSLESNDEEESTATPRTTTRYMTSSTAIELFAVGATTTTSGNEDGGSKSTAEEAPRGEGSLVVGRSPQSQDHQKLPPLTGLRGRPRRKFSTALHSTLERGGRRISFIIGRGGAGSETRKKMSEGAAGRLRETRTPVAIRRHSYQPPSLLWVREGSDSANVRGRKMRRLSEVISDWDRPSRASLGQMYAFARRESVYLARKKLAGLKDWALDLLAKLKSRQGISIRRETRATKLVATVMIVFLVCWLPFFTLNMIKIYRLMRGDWPKDLETLFHWFSTLGYLNSSLNFIIYSAINKKFRSSFRRLIGLKRRSSTRSKDRSWMLPAKELAKQKAAAKNRRKQRKRSSQPFQHHQHHHQDLLKGIPNHQDLHCPNSTARVKTQLKATNIMDHQTMEYAHVDDNLPNHPHQPGINMSETSPSVSQDNPTAKQDGGRWKSASAKQRGRVVIQNTITTIQSIHRRFSLKKPMIIVDEPTTTANDCWGADGEGGGHGWEEDERALAIGLISVSRGGKTTYRRSSDDDAINGMRRSSSEVLGGGILFPHTTCESRRDSMMSNSSASLQLHELHQLTYREVATNQLLEFDRISRGEGETSASEIFV